MKQRFSNIARRLIDYLRKQRKALILVVCVSLLIVCTILLWPMDVGFYLKTNSSGELHDRNGQLLYPVLNSDDNWCFERPLDQISPKLIQATLAVEDHRFDYHPGVDPIAVLRALYQNMRHGRTVSGASTLTMQVIKLRHGHQSSIKTKLYQQLQAIRLRLRASKEQILWSYLNNAPYGGNLIGCEAASRRYFGKPSNELNLDEAALLAGLPKAPSKYNPRLHLMQAKKRRDFVLVRMLQEDLITTQEYNEAKRKWINTTWRDFPKLSPHLAMQYRDKLNDSNKLVTTLDYSIQLKTEQIIQETVKRTWGQIENAAAIIIDSSNAEVLARVGSVDFANQEIDGQFDICQAERSPGSTLKPLLFALAMKKNQLYPCEILLDDSWDQGIYNPENFDQSYQGLITAGSVLQTSRNVPCITVLERIGQQSFHSYLQSIKFSSLHRSAEHYGLGIIIGNCEVKLEELATAYAMLANLGEYRVLKYFKDQKTAPPFRSLSRGVCIKTYEMLEAPLQNDPLAANPDRISMAPRVCWKTGTSQGYRDAWTVMFNQQYTVAVWLGNNDGRASRLLVGSRSALPLARKLFTMLPRLNRAEWPGVQGDFQEVQICSRSGLPASNWCPHTHVEHLPKSQFLNRKCDIHYPAPNQSPSANAIIERWPASPQGWDLSNITSPYIAQSKSSGAVISKELRILSPTDRSEFILTGEDNADRIQLKTSLDKDGSIHWYYETKYLGEATVDNPMYLKLQSGSHAISCMTNDGRVDKATINVLTPTE